MFLKGEPKPGSVPNGSGDLKTHTTPLVEVHTPATPVSVIHSESLDVHQTKHESVLPCDSVALSKILESYLLYDLQIQNLEYFDYLAYRN